MSVYTEQARKFMQDCNATMKFMYLGKEANADWNDNKRRDTYIVNIATPKGNMQVKFWDSISNTIKNSYPNYEVWHGQTCDEEMLQEYTRKDDGNE